jgi:hypothetical protein
MRYNDVYTFSRDKLALRGFSPDFSPGPASDEIIQGLSPDDIVFLTVGGGAGETVEGLFMKPFITARVIGPQFSYEKAEEMAWALDDIYGAVDRNTDVGEAKVLSIVNSGGKPQLLQLDAANRYHFVCSYIVETQTGRFGQ